PSSSFGFRNSNFGFLPRPRRIGPKSNRKLYCISLEKILAQSESILSVVLDRTQEGVKRDAEYQKLAMRIPKSSPPNVLIGGPVPISSGFPTVREPHRPERNRGIEAFGND